MSVYPIVVYLHIVGVLALAGALALEWAGIVGLRRAASRGQAREWTRLLVWLRPVGGPAMLIILVTGIYMMVTRWGHQGWIAMGLLGLVLMGALGGALSGRRSGAIVRIVRAVAAEDESIPADLGQRFHDPVLILSLWLRTALALGIVYIMSVKPGMAGSLAALGVALVIGVAAALPVWMRGRQPVPVEATSLE